MSTAQTCVGEYIRLELAAATDPYEMSAAVRAAMAGVKYVPPSLPQSSSAMEDEPAPSVKQEEGAASAASSKKRRRNPETVTLPSPSGLRAAASGATAAKPAASAAAASSAVSAAASSAAASLLPDASSLDGIQLLMDLFGESLQPFLTSALASYTKAEEAATRAAAAAPSASPPTNILRLSKKNTVINVATAFT